MSKEENESGNPFFLEDLYPDAKILFEIELPPIEEIKQECLVVLDTNALLFPYTSSQDNLDSISETYRILRRESRLFVPAHVAREFVERRPEKLTDLLQHLSVHKSRYLNIAVSNKLENTPMLQALPEFQKLAEVEKDVEAEVSNTISELRKRHDAALEDLMQKVRDWRWNDPVSVVYKELFSDNEINEPQIDRAQFVKDAERRKRHKIPPGYKDKNTRNLYGDLKIWHTILELGKQGKSVIFVSVDAKADWYHQSGGQNQYSRFELVEEFWRESNGHAFYQIPLSQLLKIYGASSQVVSEVAKDENPGAFGNNAREDVKRAILDWWFDSHYDGSWRERSDEFDFDLNVHTDELSHPIGTFIGHIVYIDDAYSFDITEIRRKARKLSKAVVDSGYDGGKLFIVFNHKYTAEEEKNYLNADMADNIQLFICFYQNGEFWNRLTHFLYRSRVLIINNYPIELLN